jgi:hypothetical protein
MQVRNLERQARQQGQLCGTVQPLALLYAGGHK